MHGTIIFTTLRISNNYLPDDILNGEPLPSILDILPTILLENQKALQKYGKSKHSNCGVKVPPFEWYLADEAPLQGPSDPFGLVVATKREGVLLGAN